MTNNEIQEQGQIEDQQPVMDDDYNNQGNLLRGNDNCSSAALKPVEKLLTTSFSYNVSLFEFKSNFNF